MDLAYYFSDAVVVAHQVSVFNASDTSEFELRRQFKGDSINTSVLVKRAGDMPSMCRSFMGAHAKGDHLLFLIKDGISWRLLSDCYGSSPEIKEKGIVFSRASTVQFISFH